MSRYSSGYGQRLNAARMAAGVTQTELGARIGLTRSSVANIEAGRQPQLAEQVMATALAVGCDPRWLLTGWDTGAMGPTATPPYPAHVVAQHVATLRRLADRLEERAPVARPACTDSDESASPAGGMMPFE